jgi:FlaG/FlaF family flagellin (archaellin)
MKIMILNWKLNNEKAVSVIIGIILAVVIVVALSTIVYSYISNMMDESPRKTPIVNFFADDSFKTLIVVDTNMAIDWSDINMSSTNGIVNWYNHSQTGAVDSGDLIDFKDNGFIDGDIIIRFRYVPTNTLIGTYKLSSVI